MSIKMTIGISKKVGLPDYGSAGSQCSVEVELESSALDSGEFHEKARAAYAACRAAVEDELQKHQNKANRENRPTTPPKTEYSNSPPPAERNNDNRFPVSAKQLSFINQLTKAVKGLNARRLDEFSLEKYGVPVEKLSSKDASKLIDDLKQAKEQGGL